MTQENFDLLDSVPEVRTGFNQYGKLTISTKLMLWRDKKLEEATRADFMAADKGQRAIDMRFVVDIQEFKPSLGFAYDRKVRVGGLDWQKTLVPSIEAILGKGTMAADKQNATMASLNGKYVAVIDVDEQPTKKQKEDPNAKVYKTIKFVRVYADRGECLHDASEGFAGASSANGSAQATEASDPNVPADYSRADWLSMKSDVVDAVNAAIAKAEKEATGKPKPIVTKAVEAAKAQAIAAKATELAASESQVAWLLAQ